MDFSPFKKRKLSPTKSVTVDASGNLPPGSSVGRLTHQSSYLSPTKSSLARFNPSLLPRAVSAQTGLQGQDAPEGEVEKKREDQTRSARQRSLNPTALRPSTPKDKLDVQNRTKPRASTASPSRYGQAQGKSSDRPPRRKSQTPQPAPSSRPSSSYVNAVIPASPPQRAQAARKKTPNIASDQLEHELQEVMAQSTVQDSLPDVTPTLDENAASGEPELPPTPIQLGLEQAPTPPQGLLFSSPSRRLRKKKPSSVSSSPLKPKDSQPDLGLVTSQTQAADLSTDVEDPPGDIERRKDPEILDRQATIDQLTLQLKGLQDDVTQLERWLELAGDAVLFDQQSQEEAEELLYVP